MKGIDAELSIQERAEKIAERTGADQRTILRNIDFAIALTEEIGLIQKRTEKCHEKLVSAPDSYVLTDDMFHSMVIDTSRIEEAFLLSQNRMKILADIGKTHSDFRVFDPLWWEGDEILESMYGEAKMISEDHLVLDLPPMAKDIRKNRYKTIGTYYVRIAERLLKTGIARGEIKRPFKAGTIVFQHILNKDDTHYSVPDSDNVYTKRVLDSIRANLCFGDAMNQIVTIYVGEVSDAPARTRVHIFAGKDVKTWLFGLE
jgi:hypothetical protein